MISFTSELQSIFIINTLLTQSQQNLDRGKDITSSYRMFKNSTWMLAATDKVKFASTSKKWFTTDGKINTFICLLAFAMEVDVVSILLARIWDPGFGGGFALLEYFLVI